MKTKLLVSLLFVCSLGSGWLHGMEPTPKTANESDETCSVFNQVCSYLGFGNDAYGYIWSSEYNEEKYRQQIKIRFEKAKKCAVSGMPLLWCGAVTLEATTGSCNPLSLFFADDSSSLEACNAGLEEALDKFVSDARMYRNDYLGNLRKVHRETCEAHFPQSETFNFSDDIPESLSVCSALAMMARGGFFTASSLAHLSSALYGVCYLGYSCVFKKSNREKVE